MKGLQVQSLLELSIRMNERCVKLSSYLHERTLPLFYQQEFKPLHFVLHIQCLIEKHFQWIRIYSSDASQLENSR